MWRTLHLYVMLVFLQLKKILAILVETFVRFETNCVFVSPFYSFSIETWILSLGVQCLWMLNSPHIRQYHRECNSFYFIHLAIFIEIDSELTEWVHKQSPQCSWLWARCSVYIVGIILVFQIHIIIKEGRSFSFIFFFAFSFNRESENASTLLECACVLSFIRYRIHVLVLLSL